MTPRNAMRYGVFVTDMEMAPLATRSLRLTPEVEAEVQRIADRDGLKWSEAARRMLKYAAQKMPAGWHR